MAERALDFRSDTVTRPTPAMYEAMTSAPVGDDVHGDDPTVIKLESLAASMFGKDAALFVPSGVMGNLLALGVHSGKSGGEVIMEALSHTFNFEGGGASRVWGVQVRTIAGHRGAMEPDEVRDALREKTAHTVRTKVISIENTHNFHGGAVVPLENIKAIREIAQEHGIRLHIDGARIMNASAATSISVAEYATHADSLMFCLSKGLSAPVGSMLVGDAPFIAEARILRRMLGGGMRQAGVIAAAGIVALTEMVDRLEEDHLNAKKLATGLAKINGVLIDPEEVETNIVAFKLSDPHPPYGDVVEKLKTKGLLVVTMAGKLLRMVTHKDVSSTDVDAALGILGSTLMNLKNAG